MTPYYEQDGITIFLGDCREILPTIPVVDIVLADPPYGMEFQSNYRGMQPDLDTARIKDFGPESDQ